MRTASACLISFLLAVLALVSFTEAETGPSELRAAGVADIFHSRTMIGRGLAANITVTVENHKNSCQPFKVTFFMGNFGYPTLAQRDDFCSCGDINRDGYIDNDDLSYLLPGPIFPDDPGWDPRCDLNKDGVIDIHDLYVWAKHFGQNIWGRFGLGTVINNLTTPYLCQNESVAVGFLWNTTDLSKGSYTMWAYATPIPCDVDMPEYTVAGGTITVTLAGDINNDGIVDLKDIYKIAKAYGSYPGHPMWNPNYDLNDDSKVDLKDYYIVGNQYGKTDP